MGPDYGMRNRLIHGYDVVDYGLLWDTVTDDLPPLIRSLREVTGEDVTNYNSLA